MRSPRILAALGAVLAASLATTASPAHAAVTSASMSGSTATLNLDGADDNVTVSVSNGQLVHGQTTGGLNSGADWDSSTAGDQTVPANGTFNVVVNGGDGNDAIAVLAKTTEIAGATLNGGGGDDLLTGADTNDTELSTALTTAITWPAELVCSSASLHPAARARAARKSRLTG